MSLEPRRFVSIYHTRASNWEALNSSEDFPVDAF